ncbi:hypothetical protein BDV98DRAFT_656494 [Pterulicium gracile]|uniref:F-box domain-containing protein n=1 Tax=Pterulicium gracile TaxID=1884261 RepID=A0A5C3QHR9_9AGAR|nr:hypothetical protein BDV98DRAFT_656494 [Pterula gracilis]
MDKDQLPLEVPRRVSVAWLCLPFGIDHTVVDRPQRTLITQFSTYVQRNSHLDNFYLPMQAPINKFPPEILSAVFQLSCSTGSAFYDTSRGPWVTSHVCRSWRRLSHSTPKL